jgi:chemotaxis protein histidine kinase CheA
MMSQAKARSVIPGPTPTIRVNLDRLNCLTDLADTLRTTQTHEGQTQAHRQTVLHQLCNTIQQQQHTLKQLQERLHSFRDSTMDSTPMVEATIEQLMQLALAESLALSAAIEELTILEQHIPQAIAHQHHLTTQLHTDLIDLQRTSLSEVFNRLSTVIQQLVSINPKSAELTLEGTELMIDTAIAQKLYDPLLHLVRNAFDHGLESPEVRQQQRKRVEGQITVRATQHDFHLVIEVDDDGRGLDFAQIRQRAIEMNLFPASVAAKLTETQLQDLLFEPQFSTRAQTTPLSGRGIGLDVVRSQIQALNGSIAVQTRPGHGTTFVLQIPMLSALSRVDSTVPINLAMAEEPDPPPMSAFPVPSIEEIWGHIPLSEPSPPESPPLSVQAPTAMAHSSSTGQRLKTTGLSVWLADSMVVVLSTNQLLECVSCQRDHIIYFRQQPFLNWCHQTIRIYFLSNPLNRVEKHPAPVPDPTHPINVLIVRMEQQIVGLAADLKQFIPDADLWIHPAASASPPGVCGQTRLSTGEIVPIVDGFALLQQAIAGLTGPSFSMSPNANRYTAQSTQPSRTHRLTSSRWVFKVDCSAPPFE